MKLPFGLLPARRMLPWGVRVTLEWYLGDVFESWAKRWTTAYMRGMLVVGRPSCVIRRPRGAAGSYRIGVKLVKTSIQRKVRRKHLHRMIGIRVTRRDSNRANRSVSGLSSVRDEDLAIGKQHHLRHHPALRHVFHSPASSNSSGAEHEAATLRRGWILR